MTRKPGRPLDRNPHPLSPLTERIVAVLKRIPKGKVASYGQIAALAGSPRGARQVVRILHALSDKEKIPWHRVVDRNGCISLPMEGHGSHQASLLRKEKVAVSERGAIPLKIFGWAPPGAPFPVVPPRRPIDWFAAFLHLYGRAFNPISRGFFHETDPFIPAAHFRAPDLRGLHHRYQNGNARNCRGRPQRRAQA